MNPTRVADCELCNQDGGEILLRSDLCRIVLIKDESYPGFCRVILNEHRKEMSDLSSQDRKTVFDTVIAVERAIRRLLNPDKVNLASLGNVTPHVHWHVIPRFRDDARFPNPIWGEPIRGGRDRELGVGFFESLRTEIARTLSDGG